MTGVDAHSLVCKFAYMATVRIDEPTHERLKTISTEDDVSITELIARAVKGLERARFWDLYARQIAQRTPREEVEDAEETVRWDGTLLDGLEGEPSSVAGPQ